MGRDVAEYCLRGHGPYPKRYANGQCIACSRMKDKEARARAQLTAAVRACKKVGLQVVYSVR